MSADDRHILWTQFILAAALARSARAAGITANPDEIESVPFCYADTHAGPGSLDSPAGLDAALAAPEAFANRAFFAAAVPLPDGGHPGSWMLATRVLNSLAPGRLDVEIDINDIDPRAIAAAEANRPGGSRIRYWTHDWFLFLRSRLMVASLPDFVLIDPPPDDPRGSGYAIDAAILLDTLAVPYMVTYPFDGPQDTPQDAIDQIGRAGLELCQANGGHGALLGGGAENAMLDLLPDLRRLAALLGGSLSIRLPRYDDYSI